MKRTLLAFGAAVFLFAIVFRIGAIAEPADELDDAEVAVEVASDDEATPVTFVFRRKNRRDPFEMRLTGRTPIKPTDPKIKPLTLAEQKVKVQECERLLVLMITDIQQGNFDKVVTAYEKITRIRAVVTEKELRGRVDIIREKAESYLRTNADLSAKLALGTSEDTLEKMKKLFAAKHYSVVISEYRKIEASLKKVQVSEPSLQLRITAIKAEAGSLWRKANIRQEFARRRPKIGGVFIMGPNNRSVIIDNVPVLQGETHGDYRVHKVEQDKVTFEYKGELIEQSLIPDTKSGKTRTE